MVTKHWRQDWTYEPAEIVEYQGLDRWQRRKLTTAEIRGRLVAGGLPGGRVAALREHRALAAQRELLYLAQRRHLASAAAPRMECPQRLPAADRYESPHRHPDRLVPGREQPQDSAHRQRTLSATSLTSPASMAFARYERIRDADFAGADRYYERTKEFWDRVRDRWNERLRQAGCGHAERAGRQARAVPAAVRTRR